MDSNIARTATGYLSSMLLGVSINIRFGLPQQALLSKPDILTEKEVEEIVQWGEEVYLLGDALDQSADGLSREYSKSILEMLENLDTATGTIPVSAKDMTGFDILYGELQRIFSGGDNLYE
ncbi:MAG: ATP/GTP-binding protein, partial [Candidatus Thorarchaeota archaeon]